MLLEIGLSCYAYGKAGTGKEANSFIPSGRKPCLMVFWGFFTYLRIFNFTGKNSRQLRRIWVISQTSSSLLTSWFTIASPSVQSYFHRRKILEMHNFRRELALYPQAFLCWPSVLSDSIAVSVKVVFTSKLFKNEHSRTEVWSTCVKDEAGAVSC